MYRLNFKWLWKSYNKTKQTIMLWLWENFPHCIIAMIQVLQYFDIIPLVSEGHSYQLLEGILPLVSPTSPYLSLTLSYFLFFYSCPLCSFEILSPAPFWLSNKRMQQFKLIVIATLHSFVYLLSCQYRNFVEAEKNSQLKYFLYEKTGGGAFNICTLVHFYTYIYTVLYNIYAQFWTDIENLCM